MRWPLSQDYNEAIQCPRDNFSDPDLQRGEAVTNPLGIPLPRSGNFADVYELRCPGGDRWAVKCFTREVPGLRERYAAISRHLAQAQLPFVVDFTFLDQGIRVSGRWFPVLKMQWVEGLTLNEFVRHYADKPPKLNSLLQIWVRMADWMRKAGIAHADLQHGNVLLVPGPVANSLALKLVDYDGMFVPALASSNSGEVGHPCYQHPQRSAERTYSPEVDRFPLLLVATALSCLRTGGRKLWDKYDIGDNLLFREADLRSPAKSPLFYELMKLADPQASRLVTQTIDALKGRLESVPLLETVLPELHAPAAPKPTKTAMPKRTGVIQPEATPPAADGQPTVELVTANSASPWDFVGEDKPRSRRRRKGGLLRWVACAAALGVVVLAGGVFAPPWSKTEEPPANEAWDPNARFTPHEEISKLWQIEKNMLVVECPGGPSPQYIYFGDKNWRDYDFTVRVKRLAGDSHCTLLFRRSSPGNTCRFSLGKGDKGVHLETVQDDLTSKHEPPNVPVVIEKDKPYTLRAKVRGSHIWVYVDDEQQFDVPEGTHPKEGCVGLYVESGKFAFDNIKVTHPDGKVLLQGLPDLPGKKKKAKPEVAKGG